MLIIELALNMKRAVSSFVNFCIYCKLLYLVSTFLTIHTLFSSTGLEKALLISKVNGRRRKRTDSLSLTTICSTCWAYSKTGKHNVPATERLLATRM